MSRLMFNVMLASDEMTEKMLQYPVRRITTELASVMHPDHIMIWQ